MRIRSHSFSIHGRVTEAGENLKSAACRRDIAVWVREYRNSYPCSSWKIRLIRHGLVCMVVYRPGGMWLKWVEP